MINWTQAIAKARLSITEQTLWSDFLRPIALRRLLKYIETNTQAFGDTRRPLRVRQDRAEMLQALLCSAARALERRQISREMLRNGLKALWGTQVTDLQDNKLSNTIERFTERHGGQQPPWSMVISPSRACNLRCIGCYASAGQDAEQLEWDVFTRIIREARELWGLRFFTISGGEPYAYRSQGKSVLDLAAQFPDCFFMTYTNGTLLDEQITEQMARLGNITPVISVEGFEKRTDERRGAGVFQRILEAMANLRRSQVLFGISITATRNNAEEILSDEFVDFFFGKQQAVYGWLFQYMPIGKGQTLQLLVTPEQRVWMWRRVWQIIRERKILLADLWNCGTASEGCIAAGVYGGYLYIDWNGKVMPCVFVPYATANIHDIYRAGGTLDDVYDRPYLRAIRDWQWEYGLGKQKPEEHGNWLLPCSLRDHYRTGHELIQIHKAEPEDEFAAEALRDPEYREGMIEYDKRLHELFDPIWEKEYLGVCSPGHAEEAENAPAAAYTSSR